MAKTMAKNNSEHPHVAVVTDTTLEDMLSFKLGQEVTVNKIIFEDSDEEVSYDCVEELSQLSDKLPQVAQSFSNVIILGTKKVKTEKNVVENKSIQEKTDDVAETEMVKVKTEKNAAEDKIKEKTDDAAETETVEIKTETLEEIKTAKLIVIKTESNEDVQEQIFYPENKEEKNRKNLDSRTELNEGLQQETIGSENKLEKKRRKLGPNEVVSINVENIKELHNANEHQKRYEKNNENKLSLNKPGPSTDMENLKTHTSHQESIDPIIKDNEKSLKVLESTTDDKPSEPKKSKIDFPRTKVTSRREIKKYPGKMEAMRRHSEDLSQSRNPVMPSVTNVNTTVPTNVPTNRSCTDNNNSNENVQDPSILPTLTSVAENLLIIFPTLHSYITATKTTPKTDESYKRVKAEFEALKHHCFCLSYSTTLTIILPKKDNEAFLKNFYDLAEKLAIESGTLHFSLLNLQILFGEMIQWTEYKQKKMAIFHTNSMAREKHISTPDHQNKKQNLQLMKILQVPSKPAAKSPVPVAATSMRSDSERSTPVMVSYQFKTGPPGREIEIAYNKSQQPQNPMNNQNHQTSYTAPVFTPNILKTNNTSSQPTSIANSNNQYQVKPAVAAPSNVLNENVAFNPAISNTVAATNKQTFQARQTTSAAVASSFSKPTNELNHIKANNNEANCIPTITPNVFNPNYNMINYQTGSVNQTIASNALNHHTNADPSAKPHLQFVDAYIDSLVRNNATDAVKKSKAKICLQNTRKQNMTANNNMAGVGINVANSTSSVYNQQPPAVYNQQPPAVYNQLRPAVYNQQPPAVYNQPPPAVYNQQPPAVYNRQPPAVYNRQSPAVYNQPPPFNLLPQPPYPVYQNQQYNNRYQMPQINQENQKAMPMQHYSSAINPPVPVNVQANFQERSSVSRDSGFMSPLDENTLFLDQLDSMVNAAAATHVASLDEFQQMTSHPVITHVTSLDPTVTHCPYGKCNVCNNVTKFRCIECNLSYYCSYECQQRDWPLHRTKCRLK